MLTKVSSGSSSPIASNLFQNIHKCVYRVQDRFELPQEGVQDVEMAVFCECLDFWEERSDSLGVWAPAGIAIYWFWMY
jgi:hypothetical protein